VYRQRDEYTRPIYASLYRARLENASRHNAFRVEREFLRRHSVCEARPKSQRILSRSES